MPEQDTMLSFLYDAKPRQVGLSLEHKYTNVSSICLWIFEKSCVRIRVVITAQIYIYGKGTLDKCTGGNTFAQKLKMLENPLFPWKGHLTAGLSMWP